MQASRTERLANKEQKARTESKEQQRRSEAKQKHRRVFVCVIRVMRREKGVCGECCVLYVVVVVVVVAFAHDCA